MDVIADREWNDPELDTKLLIASQGSEYKTALVEAIVSQLYSDSINISLTDVTKLPLVIESEWSAVLVIHTFQKL